MSDVAIIGVGLHPFGRFGDKTAMEMGVEAINMALADAGVEWQDVHFASGGSTSVRGPDTINRFLGLTGIQFANVMNACATSASAIQACAESITQGKSGLSIAYGMDKHPRGAFGGEPQDIGLPRWYGEAGLYLTTKFFGMKASKYVHDYDISEETLARIAAKNFRNGSKNPKAFRRTPLSVEEILASPVLNYPLRQYMFCQPDEGAGAVVMCRAEDAHKYTSTPIYLRASQIRTRNYGAYECHATSASVAASSRVADGGRGRRRLRAGRHRPAGHRRDPGPGHRGRCGADAHRRGGLL